MSLTFVTNFNSYLQVIKKVPYPVKEYVKEYIHVPQPYAVEKKIPYKVEVPVDRPYPVKVNNLKSFS